MDDQPGWWQFKIESTDGNEQIEAADVEPSVFGERLQLLTLIRALESLDRPSHVTLVRAPRYVRQGVRFGIAEWKANGWRWECFGQMVPIRDCDLWQRLDKAMQYHQLDFRRWRIDDAHTPLQGPTYKDIHHGVDSSGFLRMVHNVQGACREAFTLLRLGLRRHLPTRQRQSLATTSVQA